MCGLTTPMEGSLMCPLEHLSKWQIQDRFKLLMMKERYDVLFVKPTVYYYPEGTVNQPCRALSSCLTAKTFACFFWEKEVKEGVTIDIGATVTLRQIHVHCVL